MLSIFSLGVSIKELSCSLMFSAEWSASNVCIACCVDNIRLMFCFVFWSALVCSVYAFNMFREMLVQCISKVGMTWKFAVAAAAAAAVVVRHCFSICELVFQAPSSFQS